MGTGSIEDDDKTCNPKIWEAEKLILLKEEN